SISRTRSPSACFSTSSISAILSSVIVISVVGSRCRNPNHLRRSAMTASVTRGRALRYAGGSARGLLHHVLGHCLFARLNRYLAVYGTRRHTAEQRRVCRSPETARGMTEHITAPRKPLRSTMWAESRRLSRAFAVLICAALYCPDFVAARPPPSVSS